MPFLSVLLKLQPTRKLVITEDTMPWYQKEVWPRFCTNRSYQPEHEIKFKLGALSKCAFLPIASQKKLPKTQAAMYWYQQTWVLQRGLYWPEHEIRSTRVKSDALSAWDFPEESFLAQTIQCNVQMISKVVNWVLQWVVSNWASPKGLNARSID